MESRTSADSEAAEKNDILLPPGPVRRWLLDELTNLIAIRTYAPVAVGPLVEPTEAFFPDPFSGDRTSVRRLLRRLAMYADLDDTAVEIATTDQEANASSATARQIALAPAAGIWFVGNRQGKFRFAYDRAELATMARPELVAAAARAVTQAYRAHHQLYTQDASAAERMVDLTAVFLGFGVLVTDAAVPPPAAGNRPKRPYRVGVLMPQALAFVLAVQLRIREEDKAAINRRLRLLRPDAAAFIRSSLRWLDENVPDLHGHLGIPPRATWISAPDPSDFTRALAEDIDDEASATAEASADDTSPPATRNPDSPEGMNRDRPVFLVDRNMSFRLARLLGLPPLLLGLVASRTLVSIEVDMGMVVVVSLGLAITGFVVGRFLRDRRCSEPRCGTRLSPAMQVCPRCEGQIAGKIGHPRERLQAEERLSRQTDEG